MTKLSEATPIGYHNPDKWFVPLIVVINVAIKGTNPPNTPLPI
jgi:hypothetical protein